MPSKSELRRQWNNAGKNVVVLHQLPRGRKTPNPSPYPIKLETYLRIAGIEYISDFTEPMSKKNKTPWMTFNGQDMADSQLCMEHLAKTLDKDLSAHLSPHDRAVERSMRAIMEDHLYFCLAMERWVFGDLENIKNNIMAPFPYPNFLVNIFLNRTKNNIKAQSEGQGIGRHTQEEIRQMGVQDFRSLSDFLGNKTYMMGRDEPTEIDCVLFGFLSGTLTLEPDAFYRKKIETEMSNLREFFLRMKSKYWPDWDECLYKPPST